MKLDIDFSKGVPARVTHRMIFFVDLFESFFVLTKDLCSDLDWLKMPWTSFSSYPYDDHIQ